jgi:hypothetical protein
MNIYNQNVAFNYRGILNLDATTINTPLDATLRAVTDGMGTSSPLQLSTDQVGLSRTVNLSAGATNPRLFNEVYTINNSGAQTGTLTGYFLNATETALNGITHNLMDLQVGGVSKFKVDNSGNLFSTAGLYSGGLTLSQFVILSGISSGVARISNQLGTDFNRLQLGGTTSSFPAIKRNGTAIDFRLADDSAYCSITASLASLTTVATSNLAAGFFKDATYTVNFLTVTNTTGALRFEKTSLFADTGTINASARVQIDSTTQGFLPPRMTTTQINAIATPAEGLVVYNTTISHLCVYQAGVWVKINHSPM